MICEDCEEVQPLLKTPGVFGGPHTGVLNDGRALLYSIMEKRKHKKLSSTIDPVGDSQDVRIQFDFGGTKSIVISNSDVGKWSGEFVLCHNDLTPRNLILQSRTPADGKSSYRLAGIIDWEVAGFYQPSYELSLQDTSVFSAHRHSLIENSKLIRDNDSYAGWTRSSQDGPLSEYSSAAYQELVDGLIKEMVARRKAKANQANDKDAVIA
ncbi:hypothetical protein V491_08349 [Pseudogymnoascus sp. VKM F-3775]|nr:hypothetical protein V491_08349 [Pseudogymnoascus sp. VKM F-3775]